MSLGESASDPPVECVDLCASGVRASESLLSLPCAAVPAVVPYDTDKVRSALRSPPPVSPVPAEIDREVATAPMSLGARASLPPVECVVLCAVGVRASESRESLPSAAVPAVVPYDTVRVRFALKSPPPVNPVPAEIVVVAAGVPSTVRAAALSAACMKLSTVVDVVTFPIIKVCCKWKCRQGAYIQKFHLDASMYKSQAAEASHLPP